MLRSPKKLLGLILLMLVLAYVGWVARFEWRLGTEQPEYGNVTLLMTTFDRDGTPHDRVLARLQDDDGELYVAVNHWPRAWYRRALSNPVVDVTMDNSTRSYLAVEVEGSRHEYLMERFPLNFRSRLQMGFPPRYFLHLQPLEEE